MAVIALPILSANVIVFTTCKQAGINHEHNLVVCIHWHQLMEFNFGLSQVLAAAFIKVLFDRLIKLLLSLYVTHTHAGVISMFQ